MVSRFPLDIGRRRNTATLREILLSNLKIILLNTLVLLRDDVEAQKLATYRGFFWTPLSRRVVRGWRDIASVGDLIVELPGGSVPKFVENVFALPLL